MKRVIICIALLIMLSSFSCNAETINGLDTDEGYFSLTENNSTGAKDVVVLNLLENGHTRYTLAYRKRGESPLFTSNGLVVMNSDKTYYDYFNNKPILTVENVYRDDGLPLRYLKADSVSDEFFAPNTSVAWIKVSSITAYDWFWVIHPELTPEKYEDMRKFYETVFPEEERFPRKQITPTDHPQSRIPRDRDDELISQELKSNIRFVSARYSENGEERLDEVFFLTEKREHVIEEKGGKRKTEYTYYELFTGTWLFAELYNEKKNKNYSYWDGDLIATNYNLEYISSLWDNVSLAEEPGSTKKKPKYKIRDMYLYFDHLDRYSLYNTFSSNDNMGNDYYLYCLMRLFDKAITIGDMRRVYEMIPRENWYIPAFVQEPAIPEYTPVDKKTHPVANAQQLHDAIKNAKNGDTIVILCDIRIQQPGFLVKNKKLKIVGLQGKQPKVYVDRDTSIDYGYIFRLDKGNIEFENVIIDAGFTTGGIFAVGKSSITLGHNTEITKCKGAIRVSKNTTLVIDGANIHHNSYSVIDINPYGPEYGSGKIHFNSGEIAYNIVSWYAINIGGKTASFIMEGGSIHDNAKSETQFGLIKISGGAKAEIKGGRIYNNVAVDSAPVISCDGGTLTMSGGEIFDNRFVGDFGGGIAVGFGSGYVQSKKSTFTMTGGKIYNNRPGVSYFDRNAYDYANVFISAWEHQPTATFEMKGGEIYQTDYAGNRPDILVYGKNANLIFSGGTLDLGQVSTTEGGRLVNKK